MIDPDTKAVALVSMRYRQSCDEMPNEYDVFQGSMIMAVGHSQYFKALVYLDAWNHGFVDDPQVEEMARSLKQPHGKVTQRLAAIDAGKASVL